MTCWNEAGAKFKIKSLCSSLCEDETDEWRGRKWKNVQTTITAILTIKIKPRFRLASKQNQITMASY